MKHYIAFSLLLLSNIFAYAQKLDSNSLKPDTLKKYQLNAVTIAGKTPSLQVKIDKTLLNVDVMPDAAGLNTLELLRRIPGVTVDGQDQVKITGKNGVQVMMDGRLQTLSAQQLSSLLKGTSAATLKTIEVIANPSSRYDAAGNAGIINLIFKKSGAYGTSGNINAGYQQMSHYRQNGALSLNHKQKNLISFLNANVDNSLQHTKVAGKRIMTDKILVQDGIERQGYSNSMIRAGIDYTLSKKHTLGSVIGYQHTWDDFPSTASTLISGSGANLLLTNTIANLTENRLTANLNYQYAINDERKLTVEADWMQYSAGLANEVSNIFEESRQSVNFQSRTKNMINLFSGKTDYHWKTDKGNFESGLKLSSSETENELYANQISAGDKLDNRNDFNYKELIAAAYGSFERSYNKLNLKIGLRAEYTNMNGLSVDENGIGITLPDTSYIHLFPTFFLRYETSDKNSWGFAYSRRINRPSFQDQNPYRYQTDFFLTSQGNPLLLPQLTHSFAIDYIFDKQRQIKFNYNTTKDLIEVIRTQTGDQTIELPVNAGTRSFINVSLSTPFQLSKTFTGYFSAEPYYQFYKADLSAYAGLTKIDKGGFGFNSYLNSTIELGQNWKAGLNGWFNYASRSSIYSTKPICSVDISLKKSLLKNQLNVSIAMRDVLNTQKWQQTAVIGQLHQSSSRKWESRGLYIGANYSFGNKKVKNASSTQDKTDEQNRIKSRG